MAKIRSEEACLKLGREKKKGSQFCQGNVKKGGGFGDAVGCSKAGSRTDCFSCKELLVQ